jgi:NADH-quinone oxidoreductase subunit M
MWIWNASIQNLKSFLTSFLLFEAFSIGSVYSSDLFALFFCMETILLLMYVMMLSWNEGDIDHLFQYVAYGMLSALLILVSFIMIFLETKSTNLIDIYRIGIKNKNIFWILMCGIGIKIPIWPLCHWLPIVHTKTNLVCSALLASLVLKFSAIILIRVIGPIFPDCVAQYREVFTVFALVSMLIASINAIFQDDVKRFFAYFSIIHMNLYFVTFFNQSNKSMFVFSIFQHAFVSVIMFFTTDIIKKLFNTRSFAIIKNSAFKSHGLNTLLLLVFIMLIGGPGTSGFIAEIISFYSFSKIMYIYAIVALLAMLILGGYSFFVYLSVFRSNNKGLQKEAINACLVDNSQKIALSILCFCVLICGIFPSVILR